MGNGTTLEPTLFINSKTRYGNDSRWTITILHIAFLPIRIYTVSQRAIWSTTTGGLMRLIVITSLIRLSLRVADLIYNTIKTLTNQELLERFRRVDNVRAIIQRQSEYIYLVYSIP